MKNIKYRFVLYTTMFICLAFFNSCFAGLIKEEKSGVDNKGNVYIDFDLMAGYGRTVLPVNLQWSDYEYSLTAKKEGSDSEIVLVTKKPFSVFENGQLPVAADSYIFTLTGYLPEDTLAANPIIRGSTKVDLRQGGMKIPFRMYPVQIGTGSAEITVEFPDSIEKVECMWSTDFLISPGDASASKKQTFTSGNYLSGTGGLKKIVYSLSDLPSGVEQYVHIFLYDNTGLVGSYSDSIIVVRNRKSVASKRINIEDLHKYNVIVDINKDGKDWNYSHKEIVLVNTETGSIILIENPEGSGQFVGSVADGVYDVYIRDAGDESSNGINTGIKFDSADKELNIDFKPITLPSDGAVIFTPVTDENGNLIGGVPGEDENEYFVAVNTDDPSSSSGFEVTVGIRDGYEDAETVTIGGTEVNVGDTIGIGTTGSVPPVTNTPDAITYTITYNLADGFTAKKTLRSTYTVAESNELPGADDFNAPNGKYFDGWEITLESGSTIKASYIPQGTTGNLTLTMITKDGVIVEVDPEKDVNNEALEKIPGVYACGFSLIIKWQNDNPATGYTEVYYDYNSNGKIDGNDAKIANQNLSGYKLLAENADGTVPASDFTFTMLGGRIACLEGLGADAANKSTVNISGNSIIGNGSTTGILLESLTGKTVNIVGQMTGDYSIGLITDHKFNPSKVGYDVIAYINNADYAQLNKFNCIYKETEGENAGEYVKQKISIADSKGKKVIYLLNPNPISVPPATEHPGENVDGGVIWIDDGTGTGNLSKTDFTLGETTNITTACSVFSITVENGTFQLQDSSLNIKDVNGNGLVANTDKLGQTDKSSYSENLVAGKDYIYMHMLSTANAITPEIATAFLKTIIFKKKTEGTSDADRIKIKINLESVPFDKITEFINTSGERNPANFKYYDGSFYLNVKRGAITWQDAYNNAKNLIFNGLNGYLMTITSEVENNYIFHQLNGIRAWTGGSRYKPANDAFDQLTCTYSANYAEFYWQCGPEAGQIYWNGPFSRPIQKLEAGNNITYATGTNKVDERYTNWDTDEPNNYNYDINYDKLGISNISKGEDSMQFYLNGRWNDMNHNDTTSKGYVPESYIVEFRPYATDYGTQTASYSSISLETAY